LCLVSIKRLTGSLGLGAGSARSCVTTKKKLAEEKTIQEILAARFEEYTKF